MHTISTSKKAPTNKIVIVHFRGRNADVAHVRHVWVDDLGDYWISDEHFNYYVRLMHSSDYIVWYEDY